MVENNMMEIGFIVGFVQAAAFIAQSAMPATQ